MSRTYRKVPHFINKESLRKDFESGMYRIFHCGMTAKNANHYAKSAMAKERSDSGIFHHSGLSDVTAIAPNGAALGYKEMPQSRWVKRYANKLRRGADKAIIAGVINEMIDDAVAIEQELKEMLEYESDYYYEDYQAGVFDDDPLDWDDPHMYDDWDDPADFYPDDWDWYDPWIY